MESEAKRLSPVVRALTAPRQSGMMLEEVGPAVRQHPEPWHHLLSR